MTIKLTEWTRTVSGAIQGRAESNLKNSLQQSHQGQGGNYCCQQSQIADLEVQTVNKWIISPMRNTDAESRGSQVFHPLAATQSMPLLFLHASPTHHLHVQFTFSIPFYCLSFHFSLVSITTMKLKVLFQATAGVLPARTHNAFLSLTHSSVVVHIDDEARNSFSTRSGGSRL